MGVNEEVVRCSGDLGEDGDRTEKSSETELDTETETVLWSVI